MAEQQGLTQDEQNELLQGLTNLLTKALPAEGWRRLVIEYRQVGQHIQISVGLIRPDNSIDSFDPPEEAWTYFQLLRHRMYEKNKGTWFSTRFSIDHPGTHSIRFNYDKLPKWGDVPAEEFAVDLERYPRSAANQPDWFRARLRDMPA